MNPSARKMCLPASPYVKDEYVKYLVDSIKSAIIG